MKRRPGQLLMFHVFMFHVLFHVGPAWRLPPWEGMTAHPTTVLDYAPAREENDRLLQMIAAAASVVFIVISATAKVPTYRVNPVFLLPLMWAPYLLRRRLFLRAGHYFL